MTHNTTQPREELTADLTVTADTRNVFTEQDEREFVALYSEFLTRRDQILKGEVDPEEVTMSWGSFSLELQ